MASISLGTAALIGGLASAGGSVASGILGANAASNAASQEVAAEQQALQFQQGVWNQQQQNQQPFLNAGATSLASLSKDLSNGTFGPGSLPAAPTAPGPFTQTFTPPTLSQAQQTPGYQFTAQQGSKAILEGAGAAGGAISGGTLKALDQYNTNLADTTYSNIFNQALSTYGAGLQGYQANLQDYASQIAGYQTALQGQNQAFQQLYAPASLGEAATSNLNATGSQVAQNVSQLFGNIGASEAAGTVGSTNAITSGISGATNSLGQALLLPQILGALGGSGGNWNTGFSSGNSPVGGGMNLNQLNQLLTNAGAGPG